MFFETSKYLQEKIKEITTNNQAIKNLTEKECLCF